jgi:hypothetical protein
MYYRIYVHDAMTLVMCYRIYMQSRPRRAWTGLVGFANGTVTEPAEMRCVIANCMYWVAAVEPFGLLDPIFMGTEELLRQAAAYRSSVDILLRWLCTDPRSEEGIALHQRALDFLREHTAHIKGVILKEAYYSPPDANGFNYSVEELERFREEHDRYWTDWENSPLGILTPSKGYEDIVDPICDFVLLEYQKYRSKEYSRRDKKIGPAFPIIVCPKCTKLVMPERSGRKKYCSPCSDQARAEKYYQKATPNENRDYQWLYRLKQAGETTRRVRLHRSDVRERLEKIRVRQRESPRCQRLLKSMDL